MASTHRVALVGFGTVGKGFCEIVKMKQAMLSARYGLNISVVAVSDFNKGAIYHPDGLNVDELLKWDDAGKNLSEFDSDVEYRRGYERGWDALKTCSDTNADSMLEVTYTNLADGMPAIDHVKASLTNGKNVITTNKGPVVFGYDMLDELARQNDLRFMIEGSIMSGTPIVSLMRFMPAAEYTEISGILNGTCNYMLDAMETQGWDYEPCLKEAQRLGYAEADPSFDVGGGDARAKTIILSKLLKKPFDTHQIALTGIEDITKDMVDEAKTQGKRYKLISKLTIQGGDIKSISVQPELLCTKAESLANVGGALNALQFKTDMLGPDLTIIGPGAGKIETGFSLFSDMLYIAGATERDP